MKTNTTPFLLFAALFLLSSCYPHRRANLNYCAHVLQDGYLLVRLQDGERKVAALLEAGLFEKAAAAAAEQQEKNNKAMEAFEEAFPLCPVYFFYAYNSDKILHGQLGQGMVFDARRRPVNAHQLAGKPRLLAEFDTGYGDWLAATDEAGQAVGIAGTTPFDALLLRGPDMAPYYQVPASSPEGYERAVRKLSGQLRKYLAGPVELYSLE